MKKSNLYAFLVLVALTVVTGVATQTVESKLLLNSIVITTMAAKFSIISLFFMDIKDAHLFYKFAGAAYITVLSFVFAVTL